MRSSALQSMRCCNPVFHSRRVLAKHLPTVSKAAKWAWPAKRTAKPQLLEVRGGADFAILCASPLALIYRLDPFRLWWFNDLGSLILETFAH